MTMATMTESDVAGDGGCGGGCDGGDCGRSGMEGVCGNTGVVSTCMRQRGQRL